MALYGNTVEQALHCLLLLVGQDESGLPSTRDLAEFQGVSPSFVAKHFTKLKKAGIVLSVEGVKGGFRLGRPPSDISVLDVVDAIEGKKPLFQCREIRQACILFEDQPPRWASRGVCAIHGVMIEAEKKMRDSLAAVTLADLVERTGKTIPREFMARAGDWFESRQAERGQSKKER